VTADASYVGLDNRNCSVWHELMIVSAIYKIMKKKKEREWKFGEKEGIKGTVRAAITHHPDKFDAKCKDPDRLCPYAIFTAKKEKEDFEPHYKDQDSTLKGKPKKKAKFKEWVESNHPEFQYDENFFKNLWGATKGIFSGIRQGWNDAKASSDYQNANAEGRGFLEMKWLFHRMDEIQKVISGISNSDARLRAMQLFADFRNRVEKEIVPMIQYPKDSAELDRMRQMPNLEESKKKKKTRTIGFLNGSISIP